MDNFEVIKKLDEYHYLAKRNNKLYFITKTILLSHEEGIESANSMNKFDRQQTRLEALLFAKKQKLVNLKHCFYHQEETDQDSILQEIDELNQQRKSTMVTYFCTVEALTGFVSLRALMEEHAKTSKLPIPDSCMRQVLKKVGKLLATLHAIHISYGDISPRSILIHKRTGKVILRPFSISWEPFSNAYVDPYSLDSSNTKYSMLEYEERRGMVLIFFHNNFKEWYCSPQCVYASNFESTAVWTIENDMWAFGCVLAEMILVDHPIFSGFDNLDQVINMIDILGTSNHVEAPATLKELYENMVLNKEQRIEHLRRHIRTYSHIQVCDGLLEALEKMFLYSTVDRMKIGELLACNLANASSFYVEDSFTTIDVTTVDSSDANSLSNFDLFEESLELASLLNQKTPKPPPHEEPILSKKSEKRKQPTDDYEADVSVVTRLLQNVRRELRKLHTSNKQHATMLKEASKAQLTCLKKHRKRATSVASDTSFAEPKIIQLVVTVDDLRGDCTMNASYFTFMWNGMVKRVRRGVHKLRVMFRIDHQDFKCWETPLRVQIIDDNDMYIGECAVDVYLLGLNQQSLKHIEGWYVIGGERINGEVRIRCVAYSAADGIKSVMQQDKRDTYLQEQHFALGSHVVKLPVLEADSKVALNDSVNEHENELLRLQRLQSGTISNQLFIL